MADDLQHYYDAKYSRAAQGFAPAFPGQARFLLRWAGFANRPLRILDLGGGTGEYSAVLQSMGHDVTLFELSRVAIEKARELGVRKTVHGDFLTDSPQEAFDVVLVKGFSPLNTDDESVFASHLRRIESMLVPGGVILYWGVTNLTGQWSSSGWFNWQPVRLRAHFDEVLVLPALRYQIWLPLRVNRVISAAVVRFRALPRAFTVAAYRRARIGEKRS